MRTFRRRSITGRAVAVAAAIGVLVAVSLPGASAAASPSRSSAPAASPAPSAPSGGTTCVPTGIGTTCTGTYGGDKAWDPWNKKQISQKPVVTVNQTTNLTDQVVHVSWRYFTPSLTPSESPGGHDFYDVSMYECRGTNPPWNGNGLGDACYELSSTNGAANVQQGGPNAQGLLSTSAPHATGGLVSGATGGDPSTWTGQADFHIEAGFQENNLLRCDVNIPCSLVVLPNWGGEPTPVPGTATFSNTDTSQCQNHSYDFLAPNAVTGFAETKTSDNVTLLNYACSYADRIVVPLRFQRTAANCPSVSPAFYAQGSPMMERAMNQWIGGWCATGQVPLSMQFSYRTTEQNARQSFLQGGQAATASTDMAVVTLPPDAAAAQASSRKFTYAPLANSATEFAYYVDDPKTGSLIRHLVLNARLVTKLLTESYSLQYGCTQEPFNPYGPEWPPLPHPSNSCDPAVTHNPNSVFDDPEFLALNQHCAPAGELASYICGRADFPSDSFTERFGTFLPTVVSGYSDQTFELTRWMVSDPAAQDFINGKVDPWNMHVNINYWKQPYPVNYFTPLDNGTTTPLPFLQRHGYGPPYNVETIQAAWNPISGLDNIALKLVNYQPTADDPNLSGCSLAVCNNNSAAGWVTPAEPAQSPGTRALFSVLDAGDGAGYAFPAANLVNAANQPVPLTAASISAAVHDMKTNPDGITQYANATTTDPKAYPGAMVDYAMVPTCGLPAAKASAIADFLTRAATTGQTPGVAPGQLAPGYYPLNSAQRAQTLAAARAVKSQDCKSAPRDTTVSGLHGVHNVTTPKAGGPATNNPGTPGSGKPGSGKPGSGTSGGHGPAGGTPAGARTAAYGQKSADSGLSGFLLVLAMVLGGLLVAGGSAAWAVTATGKWPVVLRWLQQAGGRLQVMPGRLAGLVRRA
jgi:hypothetical protein